MQGAPGVVVLHTQFRREHAIPGVELVGIAALRVAAGREHCARGQQAGDGVVHARDRGSGTCTWRQSEPMKTGKQQHHGIEA